MQSIAYALLYDRYFDIAAIIMLEIGVKLGSLESRTKNIYFARFITMIINHVCKDIVLQVSQ